MTRVRYWLAAFLALLLFTPGFVQAREAKNLLLILNADSAPYETFVQQLKSRTLNPSEVKFNILAAIRNLRDGDNDVETLIEQADVIITLGPVKADILHNRRNGSKHIAALITRNQLKSYSGNLESNPRVDCAVVIDQPFARQFKVIKQLMPEAGSIGFISSSSTEREIDNIRGAAGDVGIAVYQERKAKKIHNTIKQLAINKIDGILAIPDQNVYNSKTARNILISSYHFSIPLIGYSSSFVKAGAMIGIYSSPQAIADEVYQRMQRGASCSSSKIFYPSEYTVEINPHVAESLGIQLNTHSVRTTHIEK